MILLLLLLSLFLESLRVVCLFGITKSRFLFHKYSINQTHCRRGMYFFLFFVFFFFFFEEEEEEEELEEKSREEMVR